MGNVKVSAWPSSVCTTKLPLSKALNPSYPKLQWPTEQTVVVLGTFHMWMCTTVWMSFIFSCNKILLNKLWWNKVKWTQGGWQETKEKAGLKALSLIRAPLFLPRSLLTFIWWDGWSVVWSVKRLFQSGKVPFTNNTDKHKHTHVHTTSSWMITHCPSWLLITKGEHSEGKHWLMANKSKLMSYLYFNYQPCSVTSILTQGCN